mmetsp:Transcript_40648/g.102319  ORF Transcript_40648/g.102319 Transcript_40648/m.102319 type:complete len:303 (+) Transcript_40648:991-1899(+)
MPCNRSPVGRIHETGTKHFFELMFVLRAKVVHKAGNRQRGSVGMMMKEQHLGQVLRRRCAIEFHQLAPDPWEGAIGKVMQGSSRHGTLVAETGRCGNSRIPVQSKHHKAPILQLPVLKLALNIQVGIMHHRIAPVLERLQEGIPGGVLLPVDENVGEGLRKQSITSWVGLFPGAVVRPHIVISESGQVGHDQSIECRTNLFPLRRQGGVGEVAGDNHKTEAVLCIAGPLVDAIHDRVQVVACRILTFTDMQVAYHRHFIVSTLECAHRHAQHNNSDEQSKRSFGHPTEQCSAVQCSVRRLWL